MGLFDFFKKKNTKKTEDTETVTPPKVVRTIIINTKEEPDDDYQVYENTPPALELPSLSGDLLQDIVNVARSQVGYHAFFDLDEKKKYSIYGDWTGQHGCAWCSEFVAWCAYKANIPRNIIPRGLDSKAYIDFFVEQNQYYILEEHKLHAEICAMCKGNQFIKFDEIQAGDIVVMETNFDWSNGADHTALCVGKQNGYIITVEGNYDNRVKEVLHDANYIHGICRPKYND